MQNDLKLEFVLIPTGSFLMGSSPSKDKQAQSDEMPGHTLIVSDFYMMKYPATNEQYRQFVEATGYRAPLFWKDGKYDQSKADHPVVGVSLNDARAFCRWAAEVTGLPVRLPTEPEWEKAARGTDGYLYPWGNRWEMGRCNSNESKLGGTSPVSQFSPAGDSPFGIADMAGNVQEWSASLFGPYPYDPEDGREALAYNLEEEALLPGVYETGGTSIINSQEAYVGKSLIRGGSWRENQHQSRCAYRSWAAPMHRSDDTGFRCCYELG